MRKISGTSSVHILFCLALSVAGQPRNIHYRPDNGSVSVVDGQRKYIRGLYGANSGFSMECSDMPVFGLFKSKNVAYASLWDNYPDSVSVKLPRRPVDALRVQVVGSTNHMQYDIANAELLLNYTDGTSGRLELIHGRNYTSIEQEIPYKVNEIIIPAERSKTPESLTLRVLSNDIVTGIAGVELMNE